MSIRKPLRKDGIFTRKTGKEWMLYDSKNESIHIINSTAEFVWRLSDGSRSIDEIKQELMNTYQISEGIDIGKDVDSIIEKFHELKVLQG